MKKAFVLVFTVLALLTLGTTVLAQTATAPAAGNGTSDDPYQIATLENLYWISQNSGEWGKHFIQTADINASATSEWDGGAGWTPIGNNIIGFTLTVIRRGDVRPKTAPPRVWNVPPALTPFCLVSLLTLSGFVTGLSHWNNKRPFSRPVCAKTGVFFIYHHHVDAGR